MRIRLSVSATKDIDEAWDVTAERWGPEKADELLDGFDEKLRLLARFPDAGRQRKDLAPQLRSLAVSGFVILYQRADEVLEIVRIVHGSRDLRGLLRMDDELDDPSSE